MSTTCSLCNTQPHISTHCTTLYDTITHCNTIHALHHTTNSTLLLPLLPITPTSGSIADLGLTSTDYVEVCPQSGITSSLSNLELNAMREAYAGMFATDLISITLASVKILPLLTSCLILLWSIFYCQFWTLSFVLTFFNTHFILHFILYFLIPLLLSFSPIFLGSYIRIWSPSVKDPLWGSQPNTEGEKNIMRWLRGSIYRVKVFIDIKFDLPALTLPPSYATSLPHLPYLTPTPTSMSTLHHAYTHTLTLPHYHTHTLTIPYSHRYPRCDRWARSRGPSSSVEAT